MCSSWRIGVCQGEPSGVCKLQRIKPSPSAKVWEKGHCSASSQGGDGVRPDCPRGQSGEQGPLPLCGQKDDSSQLTQTKLFLDFVTL